MKVLPAVLCVMQCLVYPTLGAEEPSMSTKWINTSGVAIDAEFVKLNRDSVVIRKNGNEFEIPFNQLSEESLEQAMRLAVPGNKSVPQASAMAPADQLHQRKLAESVIAKGGVVQIWRGSEGMEIKKPAVLPRGGIELRSIWFGGRAPP